MSSGTGTGIRQRRCWIATLAIAACITISACSSSSPHAKSTSPPPSTTAKTTLSGRHTVWLCNPVMVDDPCETAETATVVAANLTTRLQFAKPAADPKIDCFYVYPTVSDQKTLIANLNVDPEERAIAVTQASRFSQVCRVYAPMYRQATLSAIQAATSVTAKSSKVRFDVGYRDVLAAWQDYLVNDNHGRGVVFLGHSQGAGVLIQLLRQTVDPNPKVRQLLVSAVILGGNVTVKRGSDIGGDFQHIPACRATTQTGCVIAYSSFAAAPPPATQLFGRPGTGPRAGQAQDSDRQVLCVNPAAPSGGSAPVTSYFPTLRFPGLLGTVAGPVPKAATTWVSYPDRYMAQCTTANGATWLQITPVAERPPTGRDPDPRPDLGPSPLRFQRPARQPRRPRRARSGGLPVATRLSRRSERRAEHRPRPGLETRGFGLVVVHNAVRAAVGQRWGDHRWDIDAFASRVRLEHWGHPHGPRTGHKIAGRRSLRPDAGRDEVRRRRRCPIG